MKETEKERAENIAGIIFVICFCILGWLAK